MDFFTNCLKYSPIDRFTCFKALAHEFYDDVRKAGDPNNLGLFDFNEKELAAIEKELGPAGVAKLRNEC